VLSRQELADAINAYLHEHGDQTGIVDAGYVGKVERGVIRWPNAAYRQAFRAVLGAGSDADLGFYVVRGLATPSPTGSAGTAAGGWASSWVWTPAVAQALQEAQQLWQVEIPPGATAPVGVDPDRYADADDNGAGEGEAVAAFVFRWLTAAEDRLPPRPRGGGRIGGGDVERVQAMGRVFKACDNAQGGARVLPATVVFLRTCAAPMLDAAADEPTTRRMWAAVALLTLDAGWMAYDSGHQRLARRYMCTALRLAHAAEDRLLEGRVLCALSHQALHLGQAPAAVALARAAQVDADGAPARVRAMWTAMEAMALATLGQARGCARALGRAETALGRAGGGEQLPEWVDFDEGGLWGHAARCWRELGRGGECERWAGQAVAACAVEHGRTRAQRRALVAVGQAQQRQWEQAHETGLLLLDEAGQVSSHHVDEEIRVLGRMLRASGVRGCAGFVEQAEGFLRERGQRL
jgi:hypothetical protein